MTDPLKDAFQALKTSQQTLLTLIDHVPIGISVFDADGKMTLLNQAGISILGLDQVPDLQIGQLQQVFQIYIAGTEQLYPPDRLPARLGLQGQTTTVDDLEVVVAGRRIPLEVKTIPISDEQGKIIYVINAFQDISQRQQTEQLRQNYAKELERQVAEQTEALRKSQTYIQRLAETVPGNIYAWVIHADGSIEVEYTNRAISDILEADYDYILQHPEVTFERIHPDDRPGYEQRVAESAKQLCPFEHEWRIVTPSGKIKFLQGYSQPEQRSNGDICWYGIVIDITDRKQVEQTLYKNEKWLAAFSKQSPAVIYTLVQDLTGHIWFEYISSACEVITGIPAEQVLQDASALINTTHPEDLPAYTAAVAKSAETLEMFTQEWRMTTPTGELKWLQGRSQPERRPNGAIAWHGVVIDITEQRQTEEALRNSEARFQKMAAAAPGEIYVLVQHLDGTFEFEYMSPGCRDIQELEPAQVIRSPFLSFDQVHPDDRALMYGKAAHSGATLTPFSHEWRIITPSGKTKWVRVSARPERRENGAIVWYGMLLDVSKRKHTELALRESEERLRIAFQAAQLGTWDWNILTGKVVWSENMEPMFGMKSGSFDGSYEMFQAAVHPDDRERVMDAIQRAISSGQEYDVEFRIVWPDGAIRWACSKGQVFYDETGVPVRMAGIDVDITQRKQAEETLRQSEATNRAMIRAIPDLMMRIDRDGHYLAIYPSSTVKLINPERLKLGANLADVLPEALAEERIHHIRRVLEQGSVYTYEYQIVVDHELHYEEARIVPCGKDEVLIIIRDISDRYRVDQVKNEFISIVSHELRTPLTAINGSLGLLSTGKFETQPERGKELVKMAFDNSNRLVRLVNDILDLERLESGKTGLIKESCQVEVLVDTAVKSVQTIAEQFKVVIEVSTLSAEVLADGDKIVQTLVNLLSNAIKFSAPGDRVELQVEKPEQPKDRQQASDGLSYLLFCVKDQGRGIPADKLDTIFERFQQVDASDSRQKGGTGLGLAICKSIVEKHQGRIWTESTPGEGSTFYFTLPLEIA